jgi:hypothetical protein
MKQDVWGMAGRYLNCLHDIKQKDRYFDLSRESVQLRQGSLEPYWAARDGHKPLLC